MIAYQKALLLAPEKAKIHVDMADLFYNMGDYERARLSYKRAIQLDSQFETVYIEKSKLLLDEAFNPPVPYLYSSYMPDWSINAFREVLLFNPDDPIALAQVGKIQKVRGLTLAQQGRYKEAIEAYLEVSQLEPEDPELQANLAELFYNIGDYEKARLYYKRAIQLDSQFEAVYIEKSKLLFDEAFKLRTRDMYDSAISAFHKVLLFNPDDSTALSEIGKTQKERRLAVLARYGMYKEVIEAYLERLQLNPEDPKLQANIAELFYKAGDYEKARSFYRRAIQLDSQFEAVYIEKLKALLDKAFKLRTPPYLRTPNMPDSDINAFREVLLFNPDDPIALAEIKKIQKEVENLRNCPLCYMGTLIYSDKSPDSANINLSFGQLDEEVRIFFLEQIKETYPQTYEELSPQYFSRTANGWKISITFPLPTIYFKVEVLRNEAVIAHGFYGIKNGYIERKAEYNIYLTIVFESDRKLSEEKRVKRPSDSIIYVPDRRKFDKPLGNSVVYMTDRRRRRRGRRGS